MSNGRAPVRLELEARSGTKLMAELAWKMICGVQASEENTENSPHRWREDRNQELLLLLQTQIRSGPGQLSSSYPPCCRQAGRQEAAATGETPNSEAGSRIWRR